MSAADRIPSGSADDPLAVRLSRAQCEAAVEACELTGEQMRNVGCPVPDDLRAAELALDAALDQ